MSPLHQLLANFRQTATTEREKGTYFERLVKAYLLAEPLYTDLYNGQVWMWEEWRAEAAKRGLGDVGADAGIDLVAETAEGELHAIQAKFYADDARLTLKDLSTFLTAAGQRNYSHGLIFLTATKSTDHLRNAIKDQKTPISLVTLHDLKVSLIDWSQYQVNEAPVLKEKKVLRPHQRDALQFVASDLAKAERGKLIMACGTGKTFTSLKIAEHMVGAGGRVLFLVPSLSLLSQSLTEWTQESHTPLHSFAVCSDAHIGKKKGADDFEMLTHELRYPATTNATQLTGKMAAHHDSQHMNVVFSTYHSIEVISQAQQHGLPDFDLIICDEAHRTTGATFLGEDESHFVKVHDGNFIRAAKRLYMTATPRIYGNNAKAKAEQSSVAICSMDDPALYGEVLYTINFSEAVQRGLLVDYKVIVLSVEESHVSRRIQSLLQDENNQLKVDDAAKIVGCWKALAKQGLSDDLNDDNAPMQRAVAFCQVIEAKSKSKTHKVSSKEIARMFQSVVEEYQQTAEDDSLASLTCKARHVDGGMNAAEKEAELDWLKAQPPADTCHILSNVRCLSEGVDVPALDAVLFLTPRNSPVDVVQSVGRVMRRAPGKTRGYVVLPVVIPAGVKPHEALNDNKTYKVVWQVLNALRSHDDRFDADINKLELTGPNRDKMEVVAITDNIQQKQATPQKGKNKEAGRGQHSIGSPDTHHAPVAEQAEMQFEIGDVERAIYAKLVEKVGNRHHWEDWANDIAKIANTHIDRITGILENPANTHERNTFNAFAAELRDDLNDAVSDADIIEMLAQHLITKPVFDALFEGYNFAKNNPMSRAMQGILDALQEHQLNKEANTLQGFYESVKLRAQGIDNAEGKQKIVVELYDKFFRNAFPRTTERLGIVYTPVEVVDFILHSVEGILEAEFGQSLGSKNVHIIDPFTGTGTFITRLMQSGLINSNQLKHKYQHEIHANEIVLLAYYIAAINIEATYHGINGGDYVPFEGICLTDTFQMYEKDDLVDELLVHNSERRKRQKALDIRVIVGNPPYSIGQGSQNDNAANVKYPHLDSRIENTYAARSNATLAKGLYDSYIRAIRWASDRVGKSGVIGFVTNGGWLEKSAMDGVRHCLKEEFSSIYVFNLRGDIRKNMLSGGVAGEGENIFANGSMAGIAISLLVKNPHSKQQGQIHFHDIGDYLTREQKLATVSEFASVRGITEAKGWQSLTPDEHGDWLNQRDDSFDKFLALGDKKSNKPKLFNNFSLGVVTNRDLWCYNPSKQKLAHNMSGMITFYNNEVARFNTAHSGLETKQCKKLVNDFIDTDAANISWTRALKQELAKNHTFEYEPSCLVPSTYRPFYKQWMYFNRTFNEMVLQMPRIFPDAEAENLVIQVSGKGARAGFSALIATLIPSLDTIEKGQCFPLYLYDEPAVAKQGQQSSLFDAEPAKRTRRDAITDAGLAHFQKAYPADIISKEAIFYYVYGLLHSPDYRERYKNNLSKELPRIPRVKTASDFWAFSQAGRDLAEVHLNYETVPMYEGVALEHGDTPLTDDDYTVTKMKHPKVKDPHTGKNVNDLTRVVYNNRITVSGIPEAAYGYVVNGKPAIEWVIDRQRIKTDKDSGIVSDANDWAIETMHNSKYPLELLLRVITVSLETLTIIRSLPKLDI